ncbi:hypothetical protein B0T26DRAFT_646469 [Lasiosphaeria miniovina]|uniref:Uncharacterized protein n=1 Tax=Lasiosphaeria miniovina TaxID=1954250 RepID=A0AA40AJB6_9PEZI|nr:uncharacterized protein B0T26DRAFT_646469 [Lasiosphaeria miniovina]KAK0716882.1 hypothetical protein B0T26DRAFT_646469 [Lasiosphaeria miniovina]
MASPPDLDPDTTRLDRKAYLVAFLPSPMFPAHWALWIPSATDQQAGTLINVRGDPRNGFAHEFERGFRPRSCESRPLLLELGTITDHGAVVPDGPTVPSIDIAASNDVEHLALSIPPPSPSLTPAGSNPRRARVAIRNCQTWLHQLVDGMIEHAFIDSAAKEILNSAPQH